MGFSTSSAALRMSLPAQTPRSNTERRPSLGSSMGGRVSISSDRQSLSRRSSLHASATATTDPRPISDKAYRMTCMRNLIEYLSMAGFPYPLSIKQLTAPSNKDFLKIFEFLYRQLDPNFSFSSVTKKDKNVTIEDEIPHILKTIRYPYAISKSSIISCGSPHNWPKLLAMLNWMVEVIRYMETEDLSTCLFASGEGGGVHDFDDARGYAAEQERTWSYLHNAYAAFLNGEDGLLNSLDTEMLAAYIENNQQILRERDLMVEANENKKRDLAALQAKRPLEDCTERSKVLNNDKRKYIEYIAKLKEYLAATKAQVNESERQRDQRRAEKNRIEQEKDRLTTLKESQEFTPADALKLNHAQSRLQEELLKARARGEDIEQRKYKQELLEAKSLEDIEKSIAIYNHQSEQIASWDNPLQLNTRRDSTAASVLLSDPAALQSMLTATSERYTAEILERRQAAMTARESIKCLQEASSEVEGQLQVLTRRLKTMEGQYEQEKEQATRENNDALQEEERLQGEVLRLRNIATVGEREALQIYSALQLEEQALRTKYNEENEKFRCLMMRTLDIVTEHKIAITEKLAEVKNTIAKLAA